MEPCVLKIGTVTQAMRARRLLSSMGISARLIKNTGGVEGCVYGLAIHPTLFSHAMQILNENHMPYEWVNRNR